MKHLRYLLFAMLCAMTTQPAWSVTLNEELAYRVRFSRADDVTLLLNKGANPNAINDTGLPMVSVATSRTDDDAIPVLRALIAKGADMNKGGMNNQYPVVIAARENNTKLMRFLIDEAKVDYAVKDLNGMLPLEIAEYYGNAESADMIRGLTEAKLAEERARKSPERRDALIQKLAFKTCEQQYMYYYYISKQNKHSKETVAREVTRHRQEALDIMLELYQTFEVPVELAAAMKKHIEPLVTAELDAMVSNRQRRHVGIGGKADLDKRCGRLRDEWYASYVAKQAAAAEKAAAKTL
jgi:Ankyrin repeats (3 copies)